MRRPPQWISGRYYTAPGLPSTLSSPTLNRLRVFPFDIPRPCVVDRISSLVTTAVAASTLRWVVYEDNGLGYPGALLLDTGAVGDASTTGVKEATINLTLGARRYHVGAVAQGGNPTVTMFESAHSPIGIKAGDLTTTNYSSCAYGISGVTGAAPNPFTADQATLTRAVAVWLRKA